MNIAIRIKNPSPKMHFLINFFDTLQIEQVARTQNTINNYKSIPLADLKTPYAAWQPNGGPRFHATCPAPQHKSYLQFKDPIIPLTK